MKASAHCQQQQLMLLVRARQAIATFRDAAREGRRIDFRERDELVMVLHEALDELEVIWSAGATVVPNSGTD